MVLVAVAVCALALGAPACVFAHAILVQSQPVPGMELGSSPVQITATFGEPLNRQLSNLTVIGPGGSPVHVRVSVAAGGMELVVRPLARLARGIYQVRWHSVSADDGHALDGAYYFGVQSSAPQRSTQAEASPLAGTGWLRALLRGVFDGALIVFCGGVLIAAMLARGREPAAWLIPAAPGHRPLTDARRLWRFTVRVGVVAVLAGALTVLADADAAAGSLSAHSLHAYFFTNLAGEARVVMLAALVIAAWLAARRAPRSSSVFVVVALAALALSGHANSAHPRALALGSDLLHLLAASVWLGGIAHIAWVWLPRVGLLDGPERRAVIGGVLARFGRIALPAFLILAIAGLTNAVIELGSVSALWQDGYGRVLLVKVALVGSIALASYAHAIRLRRRLLMGANPDPSHGLERKHWRLLASEPVIGAGVALAAAVLVAFPPPRSQPAQRPAAPRALTVPSVPRPLSAAVGPNELSVAEEAGPLIVAVWVTHRPHAGLSVRLHTLATNEQPLDVPTRILDATATARCGVGCRTAQLTRSPAALTVQVIYGGSHYSARLPVRWNTGADALARRLLAHVEPGQLALRDVRIHETLRGGPSVPNITDYQLQAPDRFAFTFSRGSQPLGETVIIASKEWERSAGKPSWEQSQYGGGGTFAASSYLGWWAPYARAPRLMDLKRTATGTVANIATLSAIQDVGPVWLRLRLDLTHRRLLRLRMITAGHFMTQEWGAFNRPLKIRPPVTATGRH